MCWNILSRITGTHERPSPSDITPRGALMHLEDTGMVHIDLSKISIPFTKTPRVWILPVAGTGSMDPVMDAGHNDILVAGADEQEQGILHNWLSQQPPGNIVVYRIPEKIYAIHRITKVEWDTEGVKYTLKGDNNPSSDPYVVRSSNIEWVSIGTIY